ncbi:hypothetical protein FRC05_002581 [Tulasnella sp. 425]|nr:hypothetical protein FRC05_002581 [Tulasnella sp. 425]
MVLTLIGSPMSSCTRRVRTVLYEKGVGFTLRTIDLSKAEQKSEEYLKMQPFGQIPVLDLSVLRALSSKYANQGTKLIPDPKALKAVALFEQAASVEQADFDPYATGIAKGIATDGPKLQKHSDTLNAKFDGYERMLNKQRYLASNSDLWHLPYGKVVEKLAPQLFESHPKVNPWWHSLKTRPAWIEASKP